MKSVQQLCQPDLTVIYVVASMKILQLAARPGKVLTPLVFICFLFMKDARPALFIFCAVVKCTANKIAGRWCSS
jgi:hypothetical protein